MDVCSARTGAERRSQRPVDAGNDRSGTEKQDVQWTSVLRGPERSEEVSVRWTLLGNDRSVETRTTWSGRTRKKKRYIMRCISFPQSARRDSNPRPRPWQGRAPPTEPLAHRLLCRSCLPDTFDIIQHELQFVNTKFEIFMQIFRRHTIKKLTPNAIPHKIKSRDIKNVKVG